MFLLFVLISSSFSLPHVLGRKSLLTVLLQLGPISFLVVPCADAVDGEVRHCVSQAPTGTAWNGSRDQKREDEPVLIDHAHEEHHRQLQ